MRIGIFTDQFSVGISGQTTSVMLLYENLKKLGHTCYVFTSHSKKIVDENPDIINLPGVPYPFKEANKYRFSPFIKKQVRLIESYNLDIIHVHTEFYLARVALAAKAQLGIPVVYTLHTMWEYYLDYLSKTLNKMAHDKMWRFVKRVVFRKIVSGADMVVVPSTKLYNIRGRYGVGDNVVIIPTGIEFERFKKDYREKRTDDKTILLYLGRLSQEKSIDVSLRAFAEMKNRKNAEFIIVGDGPAAKSLKKLAEELEITDQAVFKGAVPWEKTPYYYQNADAFISASVTESQGLTFLEAIASRLPVYAIRDEAIADLIEDGKNGFLCDSPSQLTERMDELCENKNHSFNFDIPDRYTSEKYAENISALYKKVLDKKRNN